MERRQFELILGPLGKVSASLDQLEGTLIVVKRCLPLGGFQICAWCVSVVGTIEVFGAQDEIVIGEPFGGANVKPLPRCLQ